MIGVVGTFALLWLAFSLFQGVPEKETVAAIITYWLRLFSALGGAVLIAGNTYGRWRWKDWNER